MVVGPKHRHRLGASHLCAKTAYLKARAAKRGRPGISSLNMPPKRYRPSAIQSDFETKYESLAEDAQRVLLLRRTEHQGQWGDDALDLADRLAEGRRRYPWPTLASSLYWRDIRERVVGHVNLLIEGEEPERASFFTIVRKEWASRPADLPHVEIARFKRMFRKNIEDSGVDLDDGFLIGRFEASYDPIAQCYQFHIHGIATDAYIDAINTLKGRRPYRPWADIFGIPDCKHPVENPELPVDGVVRAFTYSLKGYWELRNAGRAKRLQGDEHTRSLLFLDRHRPEDLFLLMGVHVKGGVLNLSV